MANATIPVPMHTTAWGDDKIRRIPAAVARTWRVGAMVALDSSDNAVPCDNTAGIRFDGLVADGVRVLVTSTDTVASMTLDPSKQITVERPFRFAMKIASAAAGDVGKALYAAYDNEVSYSQTNSIFVGWVDQVLTSTLVLVRPAWSGQAVGGVVGFDGNTLTFTGATGVNIIAMPDALANALTVKEGSNAYLNFRTSNGTERVELSKNTTLAGDLIITSTDAAILQAGPNGATNPTLSVVGNVSSEAGGLQITGEADNVGVYLDAIGSNTNEPMAIAGKGSGVITIGGNATGSGSTGGTVVRVKTATVAAANSAIGNAAAVNEGFYYITGSNNTAAVILPASVAGKQVTLQNTVSTAILVVFPQPSSQINAKGVNNAYNVPNAGKRTFTCVSSTLWYTDPETIA